MKFIHIGVGRFASWAAKFAKFRPGPFELATRAGRRPKARELGRFEHGDRSVTGRRRVGKWFSSNSVIAISLVCFYMETPGDMMAVMSALTPNGLIPHSDFPSEAYEAIHSSVVARWSGVSGYHHYSGAWNALAYRFHGAIDAGAKFQKSLKDFGARPVPHQRYNREDALFSFFSSGFAAFESLFYGMFAVGSFIDAAAFPLTTPKEQQRISPSSTNEAFKKAFPGDGILDAFSDLFADPAYQRWRDMRNILTHRSAPGRRIYVGIGSDDAPPVEWKLNNLPLDSGLVPQHQRELAQLIAGVLSAANKFVSKRATIDHA